MARRNNLGAKKGNRMLKTCLAFFLLTILCLHCEESSSASRNGTKTGVFNFLECEGGLGGAMHITVADPETGEPVMMTAYKEAEGNICSLNTGTPVKITYRIEKVSGLNTFIKYSLK